MRGLPDPQQVELRIASADGTGERLLVRLPAFANFLWGATWSPDGKTIAVSFFQSGKEQQFVLNVVRVADGSMTTLYSNPALLGRPVWLPGGESLLLAVGSPKENRAQIWEIPYPKGEPRRFTNDLSNYSAYLDMTRDGRTVAALDDTRISNVWAVPGGKAALATQVTSGGVADIAVAPGPGGKFLVRTRGSELDLIDARWQPKDHPDAAGSQFHLNGGMRRPLHRVRFLYRQQL